MQQQGISKNQTEKPESRTRSVDLLSSSLRFFKPDCHVEHFGSILAEVLIFYLCIASMLSVSLVALSHLSCTTFHI